MRYPVMNRGAQYEITLPELNGGVNLYDEVTRVADTQLTDAENVWHDQGMLKTRPGIVRTSTEPWTPMEQDPEDEYVYHEPQRINDTTVVCVIGKIIQEGRDKYESIHASFIKNDGTEKQYYGESSRKSIYFYATPIWNFWLERTDEVNGESIDVYRCIRDDGVILETDYNGTLTEVEPYVPIVKTEVIGAASEQDASGNGVVNEPYNLLTGAYRVQCTTTDEAKYWRVPGDLSSGDVSYTFTYQNAESGQLETISNTVSTTESVHTDVYDPAIFGFTTGLPTYTHVRICDHLYGEVIAVYFVACKPDGTLWDGNGFTLHDQRIENNLEITVEQVIRGGENITRMALHAWYGGDSSGAQGGTRLFLSGYVQPDYYILVPEVAERQGLVYWSAAGKTNYFPENNYVNVHSKIRAMGRQDSILVLFSSSETNYLQYYAGEVTAEDVAAGKDTEALRARFVMRPLHSTIGCDCPNSVRLVNNRLVWAHTSGHVYSLTSLNQYNERSIRCISTLIEPITVPASCFGGEYKQHYMLLLNNNTMLVLDTDNSAYNSFAYYASEKRAERMLPWYKWTFNVRELDSPLVAIVADEYGMAMIGSLIVWPIGSAGNTYERGIFTVEGDTDDGEPIHCRFAGKHFDFNAIDKTKCVNRLYLSLEAEDGAEITVKTICDGNESEIAHITGDGKTTPEPRCIYVNANRVHTFGFGVECDGSFAIAGTKIKYKLTGVVR